MKSIQRQNKKTINWGVLTFLMGAGLLFNANHAKAETVDSSPSHLGTFEGSTTFTTSSHTGVQPTLAIEMKSPYGSGSYYETQSGSLTLKDTQEGATIKNTTLKGQTLLNIHPQFFSPLSKVDIRNDIITLKVDQVSYNHLSYDYSKLKPNTVYTCVIEVIENNLTRVDGSDGPVFESFALYGGLVLKDIKYKSNEVGVKQFVFTTPGDVESRIDGKFMGTPYNAVATGGTIKLKVCVVEGDYSNISLPFFTDMISVQNPSLTITGKNLLNPLIDYPIMVTKGGGLERHDGSLLAIIPVEPNTTYTMSVSMSKTKGRVIAKMSDRLIREEELRNETFSQENVYNFLRDNYSNGRVFEKAIVGTGKVSFTTLEDCHYLYINVDGAAGLESGESVDIDWVQLEKGSTATPYEPYQSNTLRFGESITLRSNGEVSDEIDLVTGKFTQRIDEKNEILTEPIVRWVEILTSTIFGQIKQADLSITGEILPTMFSVTVPTAPLSFVLNPNEEPDRQFIASEFSLTNDSQVPITIELKEFIQLTDTMEDVLPDHYDSWEDLDLTASKRIALGVVPQESESWIWYHPGTYYVADTKNKVIGRVKRKSTVDFKFTALHGQAFGYNLNPQYRLTFIFDF